MQTAQADRADDPITAALERELSLTVSHLETLRRTHQSIERSLMRHECYLETEIIQREPRPPVYVDPRLPERDRLRDRLRQIDEERRRWSTRYTEQMQTLLDRLLWLVNRHAQVRG